MLSAGSSNVASVKSISVGSSNGSSVKPYSVGSLDGSSVKSLLSVGSSMVLLYNQYHQ